MAQARESAPDGIAGYEVIEAEDGAAAVRAAATALPDLVVADLYLPGLPVDRFIAS